jgi:hypothetical protein
MAANVIKGGRPETSIKKSDTQTRRRHQSQANVQGRMAAGSKTSRYKVHFGAKRRQTLPAPLIPGDLDSKSPRDRDSVPSPEFYRTEPAGCNAKLSLTAFNESDLSTFVISGHRCLLPEPWLHGVLCSDLGVNGPPQRGTVEFQALSAVPSLYGNSLVPWVSRVSLRTRMSPAFNLYVDQHT